MTKTQKTIKETKVEADLEKERKIDEETAKLIEDILVMKKRALQPYIIFNEYGIVPRVRLMGVPKEEKKTTK